MNNNYLKLQLSFDPLLLQKDLATASTLAWQKHPNKMDYEGTWKAIALRSLGGVTHNISPLAEDGAKIYQNTPLLEKCSYFKNILKQFQCKVDAVRLLKLDSGSIIKEHFDIGLGYSYQEFRIHIPIQTNPKVIFYSCGAPFHMNIGECWYLNASEPHAVENLGTSSRIHLIIDGWRNAWTDHLFTTAGYDFELEEQQRKATKKVEIEKMIEAFQLSNTPLSTTLAETWKQKLETGDY